MNESFSSLITSAKHVLIVLPVNPNFDQVAAGLSLYLSLVEKNDVEVFCPVPMKVEFNRLVGVNKVKSEIGNKDLTISFSNYDAGNIEKVSYDIENGEFKLTVVPKTGFIAPQGEQINIGRTGASLDLVILIGGESGSDFPDISKKDFDVAKLAHVGTKSLAIDGGVMSFAKPGSAVSELVAELIRENNLEIYPEIATNLVMGIEDGSSHFESSEVTPETFEIFAYLLRSGGQRMPKVRPEPKDFPAGSIPTQPYTQSQVEPILEKIEEKEEVVENPPQDWLQPKIYKGTSVS